MYSIDDLRSFVAIAETGGVTSGARRLGISPATTSHRLAKLEAALRLTLFHRNSRVMRLTPEGQIFARRVRRILDDLAEAEPDAGSGAEDVTGTLRVTMSPWILSRFILPHLPAFRRAYPDLTLEFLAVDRFVPLAAEGQDCAIRVGQLEDSALVAQKLSDNERIICCAPSFAAEHGPFERIDAVIAAPWVTLPWQTRFAINDGSGGARDVTVKSRVLLSSSDMMTEAALAGIGLALKSRLAVWRELEEGRLIEVRPGTLNAPSAPIWFVFSPEARAGQKTRVFGDLAKRAFAPL
ncbi:MAG: LysR family transcriptional regulator [Pseudomonadota bacterium]